MNDSSANLVTCGERETSVPCERCRTELRFGDQAAICRTCGAVHHSDCWNVSGCCSFDCASSELTSTFPVLSISEDELSAAVPLPAPSPRDNFQQRPEPERKWNRTAIWAFVVALIGIPLFGLVTGMIAMVIACIALVGHTDRYKGLGFGVAAIILGLVDVIGWGIGLSMYMSPDAVVFMGLDDLSPDIAEINRLDEPLRRAMRANVLIQTHHGLQSGLGSGVILKFRDNRAWIVTNRHVVDPNYSDSTTTVPELSSITDFTVMAIGQSVVPARTEWIAPHGVDLALVSAFLDKQTVSEAMWDSSRRAKIGEEVFAVGNPHGFGWTHSSGDISQLRKRQTGLFEYSILQTSTPLNPGNSGGGLYSKDGFLLGINSLTGDKRVAEGLGFSISFETLNELLPERLKIAKTNQKNNN